MYDSVSLDAAWEMIKDWTAEEREGLRRAVPQTALDTPFRNRTVRDIAARCRRARARGAIRRGNLNEEGLDETMYVSSLEEIIATANYPGRRRRWTRTRTNGKATSTGCSMTMRTDGAGGSLDPCQGGCGPRCSRTSTQFAERKS